MSSPAVTSASSAASPAIRRVFGPLAAQTTGGGRLAGGRECAKRPSVERDRAAAEQTSDAHYGLAELRELGGTQPRLHDAYVAGRDGELRAPRRGDGERVGEFGERERRTRHRVHGCRVDRDPGCARQDVGEGAEHVLPGMVGDADPVEAELLRAGSERGLLAHRCARRGAYMDLDAHAAILPDSGLPSPPPAPSDIPVPRHGNPCPLPAAVHGAIGAPLHHSRAPTTGIHASCARTAHQGKPPPRHPPLSPTPPTSYHAC